MFKKWEDLPDCMRSESVREYYEILEKKRVTRILIRIFDFWASLILLMILAIPMIIISVLVKISSKGPVFYRQKRVTQYGEEFMIHKFRTMKKHADEEGDLLTLKDDERITSFGRFLRKTKLDELPQLFDVLAGDMSFVGTRPQNTEYVKRYKEEYYATLLLPSGITSTASILYRNESELLKKEEDVEKTYFEKILPDKMKYNLEDLKNYSLRNNLKILFKTVLAVLGKESI